MILTSTAFRNKLQNAANRVIHTKIETYDTKMCVPTKGVPFVLYDWDNYPTTPTWSGMTRRLPATGSGSAVLPNLSFNWNYSSPFYLGVPYYALEFDGYFYSEEASSDFGFYVFGDNQNVSLDFNSTSHISPSTVSHNSLQFQKSSSADSVSADTWYTFTFRVWGETGARHNGITLMYTHDFSSVDEDDFHSSGLKIVNAGVCNTTGGTESAVQVTHFSNVQGDRKRNEPTEYTFEVPLGDETGAYIRNSINEYVNGSITLHEGRLIKIWAGYECDTTPNSNETEGDVSGNIEYIPRFTGFIYGFESNRDNNVLKVRCRDFFSRTEEVFCVNYPDASSYWGAGYFKLNSPGEPDGIDVPIAYDKWNVVSAILDLFIKAGIPASLFYDYEKGRAASGYVVDTVKSVYDADYNLSSADYYGTDRVEEYLNRFDVGTTIFESIMKIVDTYGYDIEFKPNGNLRFFPKDNPTGASIGESVIDNADVSSDASYVADPAAQSGNYEIINSGLDTASEEITFGIDGSGIAGTGFSLIVVRDTDSGASDNNNIYTSGTASVDVDISIHGGASVWSDTFNFYFQETRYYSQGVSSLIGSNPCIIELTRSLDYGNYDITITNLSSSYHVKVDQLWAYHNNTTESVKTLQTYKTTGVIASISKLDYERTMEDLRNDILVVGQRRGIYVADGNQEVGIDDPEFSGQSNNQYVNYHARAMDAESIYNPNASNYTGRHLMTYVQEPSINTDQRASWLAFNMLDTYRNYKNRVNFSLIGDPEVYINDPVSVKDKVEEDGLNTVWVEGFSETIMKTKWDIAVDVVGNKPFPSYTEDQDYDIENDYNDGFISELEIVDGRGNSRDGSNKTTTTGVNQSWGTGTLNVADGSGFGSSGTVVIYHSDYAVYGVATYSGSSSSTLTLDSWLFDPTDYIAEDSSASSIPSGWRVENVYNPHERSDYGEFVILRFRCLVSGVITVGVQNLSLTDADVPIYRTIGGLSSGGGLSDSGIPKDQKVSPGEIIELIWGGVDQTGLTHKAVHGDNTEIGKGYFTESGQYYYSIDYTRDIDGRVYPLSTNKYNDEDGNPQSKTIGIGLSGVEEHTSSYVFTNPVSGSDTSRSTSAYYPGNNGGRITNVGYYNFVNRINTNYVYISLDGNIDITLKSFSMDTNRQYYITYSVGITTFYIGIGQVGDIVTITENSPDTQYIVDGELFQSGAPVTWNNSDGFTFSFNPHRNNFGGFDVDGQWAGFYNNIYPEYGNQDIFRMGVVYWMRLLLDIRDSSGRRVKYRNSNNNHVQIPETHNDLTSAVDSTYSNRNWDTVFEFLLIPIDVDQGNSGVLASDNRLTNTRYNVPYWDAIGTSLPVCWVS
jgi:hypothetical protein